MKKKIIWRIISSIMALIIITSCTMKEDPSKEISPVEAPRIQIGISFDTFVLERWLRDRDVFVSTATDLGAEVNVQNANGDSAEQLKQIQYLMDKKMDAIVVVAVDTGDALLASLLRKAKSEGIVVVCYDRLIQNVGADLYISFDNEKVGLLMAQAVISQVPEGGKIAAIFGPDTDNNVLQVISGVKAVLSANNQELVYENQAPGWKEEYAFEYVNECLEQVGEVDAIICGNDALAGMALKALAERQMADRVCVVGQDADILACQQIVEGYQYMTVYKPINALAKQAAQHTIDLVQGKPIRVNQVEEDKNYMVIDDGTYQVPFVCLEPIDVTRENIDEVIIDSQFHFREEVYLHVN